MEQEIKIQQSEDDIMKEKLNLVINVLDGLTLAQSKRVVRDALACIEEFYPIKTHLMTNS